LAHRLGKSRSQVYREALSDYLARRESRAVTDALDEVASDVGSTPDALTAAAGREALERSEW
jgi:predicted transcriptional regulator